VLDALSNYELPKDHEPPSEARYYHITNPAPLRLQDLPAMIGKIRGDETAGSILPLSEWKKLMRDRGSQTKDDVARSRQEMEWNVFEEYLNLGHRMVSLHTTRTRETLMKIKGILSGNGVVSCPPVDEVYLGKLFGSRSA
jgi:hypothetical protein